VIRRSTALTMEDMFNALKGSVRLRSKPFHRTRALRAAAFGVTVVLLVMRHR
jgi:hypothetical protein